MLLESFTPQLPTTALEIIIFIVAGLGVVMVVYSQFIEAENRRDLMRMVGAMAVLVYALYILNLIFIILALGIFIASVVEFIEIYLGYHKHTRKDVQVYKYIGKK